MIWIHQVDKMLDHTICMLAVVKTGPQCSFPCSWPSWAFLSCLKETKHKMIMKRLAFPKWDRDHQSTNNLVKFHLVLYTNLFWKGYNLQLCRGLEFYLELLCALETGQKDVIHVDDADLDPQNLVPAIKERGYINMPTFNEEVLKINDRHWT